MIKFEVSTGDSSKVQVDSYLNSTLEITDKVPVFGGNTCSQTVSNLLV